MPFTVHASHISPYSLPLLLLMYSNTQHLYAHITQDSWLVLYILANPTCKVQFGLYKHYLTSCEIPTPLCLELKL